MAPKLKQSETSPKARLQAVLDRLEDEAAFDIGQRSMLRHAVYAPITLGVLAGGYKPLYRGWATDLSLSGLGLLVEHDVPMGAVLYINLETIAGGELLLPIRVCYVSQLMSKTYRIGGTFEFTGDNRQHQPRLFG